MENDQRRQQIEKLLAKYRLAEAQVDIEKNHYIQAETELDYAEKVQSLIQEVALVVQQEAHARIARVVSRCLQSVFDHPYEFKILFERKRGRTEASLLFVRDGIEIDPLSASGGGVVDVAAFSLRLACLMLIRPPVRRLLVLDEPWKHLSETYRPRMRELVETLAEEMEVQFLIVTHSDEFRIGKVVDLS